MGCCSSNNNKKFENEDIKIVKEKPFLIVNIEETNALHHINNKYLLSLDDLGITNRRGLHIRKNEKDAKFLNIYICTCDCHSIGGLHIRPCCRYFKDDYFDITDYYSKEYFESILNKI
jgi:hypothetical protein